MAEQRNWQPISTALRDGTPVLVWHDHDSDPYYEESGERLTDYGCWAEENREMTAGMYIAVFGGGYTEDVSGEGWGPHVEYPDWWFKHDSDLEIPLAPTCWMPLPQQPEKAERLEEGDGPQAEDE